MTDTPETVSKRRFDRERRARRESERLLEEKSTELYHLNEALREEKERVERRSTAIEAAHSELKATHTQLVQSEKMASIGQLAAGVAHEINNPIAFVRSNLRVLGEMLGDVRELLDLARAAAGDDAPARAALRERLEDIDEAFEEDLTDIVTESTEGVDRVAEIVRGLKDFSRVDDNTLAEFDVNQGIESTIKVIWNEIKYKAEVISELDPALPAILAQGGKLNQVFMNLIVNAAHAIDECRERGEIRVSTASCDDGIEVRVSDNGCGIPQDKLEERFDPFYTTKPVGQGTGLGLAISFGIVSEHGGRIEVSSTQGEGTTFRIHLPSDGARDDERRIDAA